MSKHELLKDSRGSILVPDITVQRQCWGEWPISSVEARPSLGYLGPSEKLL